MKRVALTSIVLAVALVAPARAAAPEGRYALNPDAVKDTKTGLVWQRAVSEASYTWAKAASYCGALNLAGFSSGWRLPTKKELETLIDRRVTSPCIDLVAFPDTPTGKYWTSTPYAGDAAYAWHVGFSGGSTGYEDVTYTLKVRCVR